MSAAPTKHTDDTPIRESGLPNRAIQALQLYRITTLGQVRRMTDKDLANVPGIGSRTLRAIRQKLNKAPK